MTKIQNPEQVIRQATEIASIVIRFCDIAGGKLLPKDQHAIFKHYVSSEQNCLSLAAFNEFLLFSIFSMRASTFDNFHAFHL